ncbi:group III truncated hemoglobin [Methylocystis sp. B8]|uniref:group III truncated hemoglobin n=1 Tax=Methylocystis sp. B8 TaxID=544938 RepID=UPI0010FF3817|nr:group III truncated hemoglobin [Methylocystis sp. B8]TLG72175.1 group III truncated hemoglobin [Methylocystis sp. B8]
MEPDIAPIGDATECAKLEIAIDDCVRRFYAKGADDQLLGPIFTAIDGLDEHMGIVANFWSKTLLGTDRYQGHPFAAHINLPIEPQHFARWLELFSESANETLPKKQAEQAIAKAAHMTQCFQAGLFPFVGADGKPSRIPAQ